MARGKRLLKKKKKAACTSYYIGRLIIHRKKRGVAKCAQDVGRQKKKKKNGQIHTWVREVKQIIWWMAERMASRC